MEMDGQGNTCGGLSGLPGALLQISHFTANLQYTVFYNIILGLGKTTNSQDRFPVIRISFKCKDKIEVDLLFFRHFYRIRHSKIYQLTAVHFLKISAKLDIIISYD